ncbi:hypothetical protein D9613_010718 [Agrocybe pediades]|uniref:CCHC-type domain-containing protein n=1 Tax=Agrocybe pediades TaxID=84607 RepID=A0A8H4QL37_9AGAR|nr:hypothetical protein D9613_010718 [Agrocybe pediades]
MDSYIEIHLSTNDTTLPERIQRNATMSSETPADFTPTNENAPTNTTDNETNVNNDTVNNATNVPTNDNITTNAMPNVFPAAPNVPVAMPNVPLVPILDNSVPAVTPNPLLLQNLPVNDLTPADKILTYLAQSNVALQQNHSNTNAEFSRLHSENTAIMQSLLQRIAELEQQTARMSMTSNTTTYVPGTTSVPTSIATAPTSYNPSNMNASVSGLPPTMPTQPVPVPAAPVATAPAVPVATASRPPKIPVPQPKAFDGSPKKFSAFLTGLATVFGADPWTYASASSRVYYALALMTEGTAQKWASAIILAIDNNTFSITTWDEFKKLLIEKFDSRNKVMDARNTLWNLKQGTKTCDEYWAEFEQYRSDACVNDSVCLWILERNLNRSIVEKMTNLQPIPSTFDEYMRKACIFDRQWRNHRENFPTTNAMNRNNARSSNNTGNNANTASIPNSSTTSATTTTTSTTPAPMDVDRLRTIKCYNCNNMGHMSRQCPHPQRPRNPRSICQIFDSLDDDKRKEFLESIQKDFSPPAE